MTDYTPEQMRRRQQSKWTIVQAILAPLQLLTFIISVTLIIRYLSTGLDYEITTISILIKIALMWLITITGMLWEKEVFGQWFLAPQFFWEDVMNAVSLILHNGYFVALLLGASERDLVLVMLVAYASYMINFAQFLVRGLRARKQRQSAAGNPQRA
ncbi:MAG: 2-vinyl bacteriochlorophyllide hydratase [Phototrophicales bacterium]|nr:MAG: 2-vinyl bacteriochlorophyllide hydratase [Phototrophicales bacterium]